MKQSYYWVTLVFGMLLMGCKQTGETTEMEPVKVKSSDDGRNSVEWHAGIFGDYRRNDRFYFEFPGGRNDRDR